MTGTRLTRASSCRRHKRLVPHGCISVSGKQRRRIVARTSRPRRV